jgi:hypothetical protein
MAHVVVQGVRQETCEAQAGREESRQRKTTGSSPRERETPDEREGEGLETQKAIVGQRDQEGAREISSYEMVAAGLDQLPVGVARALRLLWGRGPIDAGSLRPLIEQRESWYRAFEYRPSVPSMQHLKRDETPRGMASQQRINRVNPMSSAWCFLNPPYQYIRPWAEKCVPASVGSHWFAQSVHLEAYVYFLRPRLRFMEHHPKWAYPKDLILALYSPYHAAGYDTWAWPGWAN